MSIVSPDVLPSRHNESPPDTYIGLGKIALVEAATREHRANPELDEIKLPPSIDERTLLFVRGYLGAIGYQSYYLDGLGPDVLQEVYDGAVDGSLQPLTLLGMLPSAESQQSVALM